ncbi:MAG: glycine--tRNA ligase subunit beta [Gammaproteobacteria bacterium]|nr:glycine--tRNA ligase subunit beta [Gammaproteobacteria bacterium]NIR83301.1 glycine--tRNA ligase subunit beta [Gammaproteobacteria bacterium]NIR91101.1 glycine--tRNA ligase subunit beta [Gammaproteobacteria bacterium]NIU04468.1 glycine--tRNA ligase subunit beta [Gammaproteobacteria bacterium]NIW87104.1 glycine--tRNA ligase subunit beta [Gammaproteobacteria bacterium]
MAEARDLLVEIGTEELPPKSLRELAEAFGRELASGCEAARLRHGDVAVYATPRRLSVVVQALATHQPERQVTRRGPALNAAFDARGNPTRAALGFARSCGVSLEHLERYRGKDGAWLVFRTTEVGQPASMLLPNIVRQALERLPIRRRMRWADLDVQFARPVHWVVLLFGDEVVEAQVLGVATGRETRGHRFHHPEPIAVETPTGYAKLLYSAGRVVADLDTRKELIRRQVGESALALEGHGVVSEALLEEVTGLVEWPVPVTGDFDKRFLELPEQVLIAVMQEHQRCFPVVDADGRLLAHFIAISNIESSNPDTVKTGNERVIRPRLEDAAFFYKSDLQSSLEDHLEKLKDVLFHERLGSLYDKSQRVSELAAHVAMASGQPPEAARQARRAGLLSKCDLLTEMVGEFPQLQGYMGRQYAARAGEPEPVAVALEEAYMPRFAGDAVPQTGVGRAVAIADKLDTLVGIFGIGQPPSGDKDPFALRRAALGVLRIIIEGEMDLDLPKLINAATDRYRELLPQMHPMVSQLYEFMLDRLRTYFLERGTPPDVFAAVAARRPTRPFDFARRVRAVDEFRNMPQAASLTIANKRIQNILRQASGPLPGQVNDALFSEDAEWNLAAKVVGLTPRVRELLGRGDYSGALKLLAGLRETVDDFFDAVKVMADDERIKTNRLALLNSISALFMETADISRLQSKETE